MCSPNVGRSKRAASTSSALTSMSRGCDGWPRDRKQIRGEVGATGGGFGDQPCDCGKVRPIRNRFRQDFDRSADDGEDVVEVVHDAASQLTDDLHPSGLTNFRFRGFHRQRFLKHILAFPPRRRPLLH